MNNLKLQNLYVRCRHRRRQYLYWSRVYADKAWNVREDPIARRSIARIKAYAQLISRSVPTAVVVVVFVFP